MKDLQEKGKAGYQAVLSTLFHIGTTAQDKFNQIGLNVEEILKELKRRKGADTAKFRFVVDGGSKSADGGMGNIESCDDFPPGGAGNVSSCDDDVCGDDTGENISGNVASCTDDVC